MSNTINIFGNGGKSLWEGYKSTWTPENILIGATLLGTSISSPLRTTAHGAERIAGANATRGGVLSAEGIGYTKQYGRAISQADGATIYLHEINPGRFNAVVEGRKGVITTMENWSQKSINRVAKNYGWKIE